MAGELSIRVNLAIVGRPPSCRLVEMTQGLGGKTILILCEKPDAAARLAKALNEAGKVREKKLNGVPYYESSRNGDRLIIISALGHLYTVAPKVKDRDVYPVFDFYWAPRYEVERNSGQTKKWIEAISKLSKDAQEYVLATDYDIEGATIGYTVLKYACGGKDAEAKRMKFSTLTADELRKSYEEMLPHIEFSTAEAGMCRHLIDALYGINLSRAMTTAAKRWSGRYATISTGRVQGPTLKFLVEREKEINTFVPTPYWTVKALIQIGGSTYEAEYEKKAIWNLEEASSIVKACSGKLGTVTRVDVRKTKQKPPTPFDLSSLQTEAYSLFKYTPRRTSNIAERLYLEALISYPRTSSQKLPPAIGYRNILEALGRHPSYKGLTSDLLERGDLVPNEGAKSDPAHPAIYPTGNMPERVLSEPERRLWDLIVRRFMAVFGEPAIRQSVKVTVEIGGHIFYLRGRQIVEEGWMRFYKPYVRFEDVLLPQIEEGEKVKVERVVREDKFTKPPPRYNPSSLLKRMEKEGIGTKATRADIIETLYKRGYISGESIVVSNLGFDVIEILSGYCPQVISVDFTRDLEEKMEMIQIGSEKMESVVNRAIRHLKPVLGTLKSRETEIGKALSESIRKTRMDERIVGQCPVCGTGKLLILRSRRTKKRFIGCTNFFKGLCKASFPLPQKGTLKPLRKNCKLCGWPLIQVRSRGRRPWNLCFNPECPSKERVKQG
ncbi:DNA topoisomerase I [Candidatus Bathyarchaeota archaeon]|nr:MAG: DNA topoisomerase I [Candidatus Bathyarchaeota archaeon]